MGNAPNVGTRWKDTAGVELVPRVPKERWRRAALGLFGVAIEGAEVFAEAEGADTLVERGAAAPEETLEERFELEGAGDVLVDFG